MARQIATMLHKSFMQRGEVHLLQHHFQIQIAPGYCVVLIMLHGFGKAKHKCEGGGHYVRALTEP